MKKVSILKSEEKLKKIRLVVKIIGWVMLLLTTLLVLHLFFQGYLTDAKKLQAVVSRAGILGPLLFLAVQIVQVAIPILPGGVTTLAGVMIFGNFWGFVWNYIGICIGSILGFHIAKVFGRPILHAFFKPETVASYEKHTNTESNFTKYFAWAIFLPIAPDDLLCYIAGTTSMSYKTFTWIILLGKPASLLIYSLGLTSLLKHFLGIG
ncbi:TVP38/TMEM64 family protein [Streptococcus gallolyticus]|uniref:TVP38/TMEM64 family protein n=1 Tax=Streptococcus hepaticus TaxID=3349163 RepID=UPI001C940445|nr:TVP38/TMEM64 family protein [Streptococcus gallolyticus]MBY5042023.1 TVP38/TMEM64 family protein [Streptococcus gallolyticus]